MTHVHLIGIGGSGLSAIARLLLERGYVVSGSDQQSSAATEELARMGAHVFVGHRAENIHGADLVDAMAKPLQSDGKGRRQRRLGRHIM